MMLDRYVVNITVKFTKTYLPKTYTVTAEYKEVKVSIRS